MRMVLLEIAITTALLMIVSSILGINIFQEHFIYWIFLVGVIMVISSIGSLPFVSFQYSIQSGSMGMVLVIGSWALLTTYILITGYLPPGYPPKSDYELAKNCNTTEWVIMLSYYDKYDISHDEESNYTGTSDEADIFVEKKAKYWKKDNPNLRIRNIEKILVSIPKDYYTKHAFER